MNNAQSRLRVALTGLACLAMLAVPAVAQAKKAPKTSFAVVGSDGTLARGSSDIVSSSRIAAGAYEVITNHDVTGCAYVADPGVIGSSGAIGAPAFTVTALRGATTTGVFVNAFNSTGASTDFSFHLHIDCNPKGYWAVVNSDGSLSRGTTRVSHTTHLGAGEYEVIFNKNVTKCAYTANVGNPGAGNPAALTSSVAPRSGNNDGVFISIQDTSGTLTDASFHLDVACGKKALDAVVNTDGTLVRGANTTGTVHAGTGAYDVDFNQSVAGCSFVASNGTPSAFVPTQGTATVAGQIGNADGVFVQTFALNGTQSDRSFYLIVYC